MQISFNGIYRVSTPKDYTKKRAKAQKDAFLNVLNGRKTPLYKKEEQEELRNYFSYAVKDYTAPGKGQIKDNEGALCFRFNNKEYILTGDDKKRYKEEKIKASSSNSKEKGFGAIKKETVESAKNENNLGFIGLDSINGKRLDIISISTPEKIEEDDETKGFFNAGIII